MTEEPNSVPCLTGDLRELVVEQLHRYYTEGGEGIGRQLWNDDFRDFVVVAADLVQADLAVWMHEGEFLVPVYNGPRAESLVGRYKVPLQSNRTAPGVLAKTFQLEQSIGAEAAAGGSLVFDAQVEEMLGIRPISYLVAPLYFGHGLRGVVSAVRFVDASESSFAIPDSFVPADNLRFEKMVTWLGRLIDEIAFNQAFDL